MNYSIYLSIPSLVCLHLPFCQEISSARGMLFMADHGPRGRGFPPSSSHSLVTTNPNFLLPYQSGCRANFFKS